MSRVSPGPKRAGDKLACLRIARGSPLTQRAGPLESNHHKAACPALALRSISLSRCLFSPSAPGGGSCRVMYVRIAHDGARGARNAPQGLRVSPQPRPALRSRPCRRVRLGATRRQVPPRGRHVPRRSARTPAARHHRPAACDHRAHRGGRRQGLQAPQLGRTHRGRSDEMDAPRNRPRAAHHAGDGPLHSHRFGSARTHRRPAADRQDGVAPTHRPSGNQKPPEDAPHGAARGRAAGGSNRHATDADRLRPPSRWQY